MTSSLWAHTLNQINKFKVSKNRSAEDIATTYDYIDMVLRLKHTYYFADVWKENKIGSLDK